MTRCNFFWGSHGCDLDKDHNSSHQCGLKTDLCSQFEQLSYGEVDNFEEVKGVVRYALYNIDDEFVRWSKWQDSFGWYQ